MNEKLDLNDDEIEAQVKALVGPTFSENETHIFHLAIATMLERAIRGQEPKCFNDIVRLAREVITSVKIQLR